MARRIYLKKKPWQEAQRIFLEAFRSTTPLPGEEVPVKESLGRVTSEGVKAKISSPHYHAAAMDGIAVRADSTVGAAPSNPRKLAIGREADFVETGDPIAGRYDSVIMVEEINRVDDNLVEIYSSIPPYKHVRREGEDFQAGSILLPKGHRIRPIDLGGVLAGGVSRLWVRRKPRVGIIPTGSELTEPGAMPGPGEIIEYNSIVVSGMVLRWGGEPERCPPVKNDLARIKAAVSTSIAQNDLTVTIAGSSAGSGDLVPEAVEELGEILVHGVDLMPGKPVLLGRIGDRPMVGLPGYPVSAWVAADTFLKPIMLLMLGLEVQPRRAIKAVLSQDIASKLGMDEIVRVTLDQDESGSRVSPLPRGAGLITSLMRAHGVIRIPPNLEGLNRGTEVEVELLDGSIVR